MLCLMHRIVFKAKHSIVPLSPSFSIPSDRGSCHHETEIAVLIGQTISKIEVKDAAAAIAGYGLALDLTLRICKISLKNKVILGKWLKRLMSVITVYET